MALRSRRRHRPTPSPTIRREETCTGSPWRAEAPKTSSEASCCRHTWANGRIVLGGTPCVANREYVFNLGQPEDGTTIWIKLCRVISGIGWTEDLPPWRGVANLISPSDIFLIRVKTTFLLCRCNKTYEGLIKALFLNATPIAYVWLQATDGGEFDLDYSASLSSMKPLNCGSDLNSLTHVASTNKTSVVATWRAPANFSGSPTFVATVVKEKEIFWIGLEATTGGSGQMNAKHSALMLLWLLWAVI